MAAIAPWSKRKGHEVRGCVIDPLHLLSIFPE